MSEKEFKPTSWVIGNKTAVYVATLILTIAGIYAYVALPKEQFPDIVIPTVYVQTAYPGTSPTDIENLITRPIEKELKAVQDVKKITSNSVQDFSAVIVEFNTGVDVAVAKQRVTDAVDKAKAELPEDLEKDPAVAEIDFSEFPIMNINLAGDFDLDRLKEYAEDMQDQIESLTEIRRVDILGALTREIQVNVDLYRMQAAGFTFADVQSALASENVNISGGDLVMDNVRRTLRVTGEFQNVRELENVIVRSGTGSQVFLKEIADVEDAYEEVQDFARLEGKPVVTLNVIKRNGENLISAADKIIEIVDQMKEEKLPEGLKVTITGDQSESARVQLNDLVNSVIIGFILVTLVLMFFMGTTNAAFVGLSVPLSVLVTFLILPIMGYSLNVIVLFSLLLAMGIIVDDAIVVIENTYRIFHTEDITVIEAAKKASGEVFVPVFAGTLTTLAPFFPLLFWPGIVGEFMKYLPWTLIIVLGASLFVAFLINPVFAVSFMKKDAVDHTGKSRFRGLRVPIVISLIVAVIAYVSGNIAIGNLAMLVVILIILNIFVFTPMIRYFQDRVLPRFMHTYKRSLRYAIHGRRPYWFLGGTTVALIIIFVLTGIVGPTVDFFPSGDPNYVYVYNEMPIGTDAKYTDSVTRLMEDRVYEVISKANPDVKSIIANVGLGAGNEFDRGGNVTPNKSKISIAFVEFNKRKGISTEAYLPKLREALKGIPGAEVTVEKEQNGPPVGKPINIEITGEEFDTLIVVQDRVKRAIRQSGIEGIEELKSDLQLNKPELTINIDREKALREGISTAQIAMQVRNALYGLEATQYREGEDEYKVMVRLAEDYRKNLEDILNMRVIFRDNASGQFRDIPLRALATVEYSSTFDKINRRDMKRVVTLSSNVLEGYNANEIVPQLNSLFSELDLPDGYTIKMTGEQEEQAETAQFLFVALIASLLLIFFVLVAQFNSISKPFIIGSTVVFSLIGVLLGFIVTGMPMSIVMTGVGIVALGGIVVKNGILLIEFIDEYRARGYDTHTAIIEASSIRLTPVLLTAASTVLGLVPLAVGLNINFATLFTEFDPQLFIGGDNAAFWGPLAWTIIFGLTFSSFLTLILVPSMYLIVDRTGEKIRNRRKKEIYQ